MLSNNTEGVLWAGNMEQKIFCRSECILYALEALLQY